MLPPNDTQQPASAPAPWNRKGPSAKYGLLLAALLGLGALGSLAAHELGIERQQARTLVDQARVEVRHGEQARAVLALERAKLIAPRAGFVQAALAEGGVREAMSPLARQVAWLAPREWSFLMVTLGWTVGVGLAVSLVVNGTSRGSRRLLFGASLLFATAGVGVVQSTFTSQALAVVNQATGALVAPYPGAGATADLRAGVVVVVGTRYGAFVQVRSPDGARGWVSERALRSVMAG